MSPYETNVRHLQRQIAYVRPIVILLALIALLEQPSSPHTSRCLSFLISYLILAVLAIPFEALQSFWHLPLVADLLALLFFMLLMLHKQVFAPCAGRATHWLRLGHFEDFFAPVRKRRIGRHWSPSGD